MLSTVVRPTDPRCRGVMNQTTSRTDSKRRDTAALSGSAGKTRLPPISKPASKQAATTGRAKSGKPEVVNSGPPRGKSGRNEDAPKKEDSRGGRGRGGKNLAGAVNRANPGRGLAGTVNRAMAANRGGVNKPADDVKLNRKYSGVVCETCKLQIHEKLKRGYAKYRSLEKMKSCEKCQKSVIDFDFYQICIDCAKDLRVCAKCASGSTMISGERFVQVVRQGVEENILSMNERELSQFAKKHAKIGIVEQKISTIEDQTSDNSVTSTRTHSARSSAKSRKVLSARSNRSSKLQSPQQVGAKLTVEKIPQVAATQSTKVSKNARSMTSSSSPLIAGEREGCLSGSESDEAYGSGHISSVSDVKTVRSGKLSNRSRHKSSEILRQIRSLTNLQVTSPTSVQSVIREIRSLTEMDCYDDDEDEYQSKGRQTPENRKAGAECEEKREQLTHSAKPPSYTPGTSGKSNLREDAEMNERNNSRSRTPDIPPITITGTVTTSVREYSPSPPVVTITTITKERPEGSSTGSSTGSSVGSTSSSETEVEDEIDANCDKIKFYSSKEKEENVVDVATNLDTGSLSDDNTIEIEEEQSSPSVGDEVAILSEDENVRESVLTEQSEEAILSEDLEESVLTVQSGEAMLSEDLEESVSTVQSQEAILSEDLEESVLIAQSEEAILSEDLEESVLTAQSGEAMLFEDLEESVLTVQSGEAMLSEDLEESVSTVQSQEAILSEDLEESVLIAQSEEAILSEDLEESVLTAQSGEAMLSEDLEESISTVQSQEAILSEDLEESVLITQSEKAILNSDNVKKSATTEQNEEVIHSEIVEESVSTAQSEEAMLSEDLEESVSTVQSPEAILSEDVESSKNESDAASTVSQHKETDQNLPNTELDLVAIEDVSEEELQEVKLSCQKQTVQASEETSADRISSACIEVNSDIKTTPGMETVELESFQRNNNDDVRIEDVTDDPCIEIGIPDNLGTPESSSDSSTERMDEARLSSELETFLGDTPKSLETEYSPRNQQPRSQDPSSSEVQVSSSVSDLQPEINFEEIAPRSRKPIFERQMSEDNELDAVVDTVGVKFDDFSQFHQNHAFDIVEIHKNSPEEEILYDAGPEEQDYYQYHYNTRLRVRLEDIPEEGTLSKESTYLSHPFTDSFDKENTVIDREESLVQSERSDLGSGEKGTVTEAHVVENDPSELEREQSVEIAVNDIVNCALVRASLSLKNDNSAVSVDTTS
ncbi:hypothetical protein ACHWQZ_G010559 [Mnemiopsis leidyi]